MKQRKPLESLIFTIRNHKVIIEEEGHQNAFLNHGRPGDMECQLWRVEES